MPATKSYSSLIAAGTSVPAGTSKSSPVTGSVVDVRNTYDGELVWRITNGGSLTAPCIIMFQISHDGTNWFDFYPVSSNDLLTGTVSQGPSVGMGAGVMYLRAIAYGNLNNACTVEAGVQLLTGI